MPYIACPACAKTIDISNVKFTVNERTYLDDEIYKSLREHIRSLRDIRCPHCKQRISLEVESQIFTYIWVSKKNSWTPRQQRIKWGIKWGSGHEPALEYYDEEDE